ncbi:hypothetical protein K435DRAFT_867067 [Dendrothele bispora CBS 962.96]|uniref:Uncharacterized protein n=1 Tax=Dendrothele bispora (strain CBS 962.96) TaxID=1314807 RepID=A0A4S8LFV5_DENBC|nr:hypothetical protein K435DRAFT_867067 [Dendrothele bispora CBS 962.96]
MSSSTPNLSSENTCPTCQQLLPVKLAQGGEMPGTYFVQCLRCKYFHRFPTADAQRAYDSGWSPRRVSPLLARTLPSNSALPSTQSAPMSNTTRTAAVRCAGGCTKGKVNNYCKRGRCKNCCIDAGGCRHQGHDASMRSRRALKKRRLLEPSTRDNIVDPFLPSRSTSSAHTSSPLSFSLPSSLSSIFVSPPWPTTSLRLPTPEYLQEIDRRLDDFDVNEDLQAEEWSKTSEDIQRDLAQLDALLAESDTPLSPNRHVSSADAELPLRRPYSPSSDIPDVLPRSPSLPPAIPSTFLPSLASSSSRPLDTSRKTLDRLKTVHLPDIWSGTRDSVSPQKPRGPGQAVKLHQRAFTVICFPNNDEEPVRRTIQSPPSWPNYAFLQDASVLSSLAGACADNIDVKPITAVELYDTKRRWWSSIDLNYTFHLTADCVVILRRLGVRSCPGLDDIITATAAPNVLHLRANIRSERSYITKQLNDKKERKRKGLSGIKFLEDGSIEISDSESESDDIPAASRKRKRSCSPSPLSAMLPSTSSSLLIHSSPCSSSSSSSSSISASTSASTPASTPACSPLVPLPSDSDRPWPYGYHVCDVAAKSSVESG